MNDWNDAERRVERAQELYEQRKLHEAVEELRAAIAINPYNSGWFFNLGLTLDELDRAEEAIDAYKAALDIDPNDLQTMNRLGMDLHRVGRLKQALATFQKIENIDPSFEPAYCNRIITLAEMGEHEKAEEMFYLGRLYKEHCPRCYYYMGCSLNARGLYDKAIYCWRKTLDLDEEHPDAHIRIAEALWAKGELEQARRHYLAGLRQDPGSIETILDLGELLVEMGRIDEAGEKARRAIEMAPDEPAAHYAYGKWLLGRGCEEEAVVELLKTLRLDPTFPGAHLHLARIHHRRRETIEARRHLRGELLLKPEDPSILLSLGNLLLDSGDPRLATATLKRLVQLESGNAHAWINLAVAYFVRERYGEGIQACKRALECEPQNTLAIFNLALANEHLRRYGEAMDWVRRGLEKDAKDLSLQKMELRLRVLQLRSRVVRAVKFCVGKRSQ
jgi:tetratricopeptide (TPR) repeat protein